MSKFNGLPSDNAKTCAPGESIFYRPMSAVNHQYRAQRQSVSNQSTNNQPSRPNNRRRANLKPVGRIALGGKRKSIATNKSDTSQQQKLLRSYKQNYSRATFASFDKDKLPPNTVKCALVKKSLGTQRRYVGHFGGSRTPQFKKCQMLSIREEALQTKLELVQYDKNLNPKRKEEEIARLKFGLEQDPNSRKRKQDRPFWFQFDEKVETKKDTKAAATNGTNGTNGTNSSEAKKDYRHWLGKPKKDEQNYTYVMMEWDEKAKMAAVYPVTFVEFAPRSQLVADGHVSSEYAEQQHRKALEKWRKQRTQIEDKDLFDEVFGKKDESKRPKANELSEDMKQCIRDSMMDKEINKEREQFLRESLGEDYDTYMEERENYQKDKRNGKFGSLQVGDNEENTFDGKVLNARLKRTKTRGQLDELGDFDEIISDDEDDTNLNDYDIVDDEEEDILEDEAEADEEMDASFQKLQANLVADDLHRKEYPLPKAEKKEETLTDDEDDGDTWAISEDEDDDEDDDGGGGVTVKRKGQDKESGKKRKREVSPNTKSAKKKRRKLNDDDMSKLNEELEAFVIKTLKLNPGGLIMADLWSKISAALSFDHDTMKKALPFVIKAVAKRRTKADGQKYYTLKNKK